MNEADRNYASEVGRSAGNALADMIPTNDEFKYRNYNDDFYFDGLNLNTPYMNNNFYY